MPASKTLSPVEEVCNSIELRQKEYAKALPPQIPSARFVRVAITAIRTTPKLLDCDRASLYGAIQKCAQDGLLPDGREAAIIPYGQTARFMPMIQGILKKARNSGEIKSISAQIVYRNDEYDHWTDEQGEHFKHRPAREDRGDVLLTFAFAQTKDGGIYFEEITATEMAAIEKMSKANDSPWKGPFRTEMMRKSALRRLLKYRVPSSTDLDDMIRQDDDLYTPPPPVPEKQDVPTPTTSSRLRSVVDTTVASEPETKAAPKDAEAEAGLPI